MANIESTNTRSSFFPNSKTDSTSRSKATKALKRNDVTRASELESMSKKDAKVDISSAIKDFSRIKKAVDNAPDIDNSKKIADLKARIQSGSYSVDYDALADRILSSEF